MTVRFVQAYLRADPRAREMVPLRPDDPSDRARAVARAGERPCSDTVLAALRAQSAALGPSEARSSSLEALARGAACVVTGQQVGLFGGPLYTVYKAAAAVVNARALAAETGREVVPVFWLQSEDHDLPEIATAYTPVANAAPRAFTAPVHADNRRSVAGLTLPPEVQGLLAQLRAALEGMPHADETVRRLEAAYSPGATWVSSFARWLAELFEPEGLLLVDPTAPALFGPVAAAHRRAFEARGEIAHALRARAEALRAHGFGVPVHVRPGAPLSFVHPEGRGGPRYRVAPGPGPGPGDRWQLIGAERTISAGELEALFDAGHVSTSALLRPILQDSLLPTAAYVGGPGEIDYFAQLGPLYEAFELPLPLLVPRARFFVAEHKVARRLEALGLVAEDLGKDPDAVLAQITPVPTGPEAPDAVQARLLEGFEAEMARLRPTLVALQPTLGKAADRTEDTIQRACGKLVDKYRAALAAADTSRAEAVRRLQAQLFPNREPQERILSMAAFGACYGDRAFVQAVLRAVRPFHGEAEVLTP